MPATTCVTMYAGVSFQAIRPPAAAPMVTAGLKWPPEMWPTAYAITSDGEAEGEGDAEPADADVGVAVVARTAVPQPPKTSTKVPRNSAVSFLVVLGWLPRLPPGVRGPVGRTTFEYGHAARPSGGRGRRVARVVSG